jgi:hypothetical protein
MFKRRGTLLRLSIILCLLASQASATTWFNPPLFTLVDGTTSNASQVNSNFAGIISDGNAGETNLLAQAAALPPQGLPAGAVVMINGASCPVSNYVAADGTNGTVDLRGVFIRGTGGNAAALGVYQADAMQAHAHTATALLESIQNSGPPVAGPGGSLSIVTGITFNSSPPNTQAQSGGDVETRPLAVVLLHCVKQ